MADSNAEFTKKILVDIEVKSEQVKKDIPALTDILEKYNAELKVLKASQKDLDASGKQNSSTYKNNTKDIVETTQAIRQLKADLREANKYIDNASKAIYAETGSIQQNRAVLSLVTSDYVKLGQAENQTSASTEKMAADINQLTNVLKEQEIKIGQTYRNVGNYTDSINKSNIALQKSTGGMQVFAAATETVRKGIGFLPQDVGGATAALGKLNGVFGIVQTAATAFNVGFKTQAVIVKEARDAELNLVKAKEIVTAATIAETTAQEALAAGTGSAIAVQAASIEKTEAQAAAMTADAIATDTAATATGTFSNALRYLKVALLSTGIGAIILALGALAEYFTNSNDGAREFEVVTTRAGASIDVLKGKIVEAGREIFNFGKNVEDVGEKQEKTFGQKAIAMLETYIAKIVQTAQKLTNPLSGNGISDSLESTKKQAKEAAEAAEVLVRARQKLTIQEREYNNTTKIENQNELAVQRARIRNLHYTTEERQAAAEKAKKIANDLYENDKKFALESQRIIDGQQALKAKAGVRVDKVAIAEAKGRLLTLKGQHDREMEMLDAREARVDKMADKEEQKAKDKAERDSARAEALRQKQQAAYDASEQLRKESLAREMQDIYEEYGDRVIAVDVQYSKELNQLKEFLTKKLITQDQFNKVSAQMQREHESHIGKIIEDFNRIDVERFKRASAELTTLQIQSIQNDAERNIAALNQRSDQQQDALDKQSFELLRNMDKLKIEIGNLKGEEQAEAQKRYDTDLQLLKINGQKKEEITKQTAADIARINKNSFDQQNKLKDSNDVTEATTKFGANSGEALAARQAQLLDNYNAEVSNEALTAAAKLEIERKYLFDKDALDKQAHVANLEFALSAAQEISGGVLDIISQSNQQASEAKLNQLNNAKAAELENTSLTNTQKKLIEAKYAKLEKAEKERAFKANQKLQVANIAINGAVGITKTIAEMGFLPALPLIGLITAQTALAIGKVLSAKPGFARGGQFVSDGRGAVLPGYSRTDNTNAYLRSGEAVVVSEAMRVPWARNAVSKINQMFGGRSFDVAASGSKPGFFAGGIYTDGGNANRYYQQPVVNSENLANTIAYQLINNMPPIYVDVKDVSSQQGILAQTVNRVNL